MFAALFNVFVEYKSTKAQGDLTWLPKAKIL
jgi:hypothetical protein